MGSSAGRWTGPGAPILASLPLEAETLTALENWVEKGTAPDSVRATVSAADPDVVAAGWPATRSRPLCAYPKQAMLRNGATDIEDAASFECR